MNRRAFLLAPVAASASSTAAAHPARRDPFLALCNALPICPSCGMVAEIRYAETGPLGPWPVACSCGWLGEHRLT